MLLFFFLNNVLLLLLQLYFYFYIIIIASWVYPESRLTAQGLLYLFFSTAWGTLKHIIPPEDDILQVKRVLHDAGGGNPDPQDVLQRGDVRGSWDSLHVTQVAKKKKTAQNRVKIKKKSLKNTT